MCTTAQTCAQKPLRTAYPRQISEQEQQHLLKISAGKKPCAAHAVVIGRQREYGAEQLSPSAHACENYVEMTSLNSRSSISQSKQGAGRAIGGGGGEKCAENVSG